MNTMMNVWSSLAISPWISPLERPQAGPTATAAEGIRGTAVRRHTGTLQYRLFIPAEYAGETLPLVVMLHGGRQNAADFALETGMNALAEQYGCAVLYPEQSSRANWSLCWNWFETEHHQRGRGEPALIAALTRSIIDEHATHPARVYAAGLSAGGAVAVILGRTYPELSSAVGSHSGLAHGIATDRYSGTSGVGNPLVSGCRSDGAAASQRRPVGARAARSMTMRRPER